ncbi:MAG: HAMP domain-containing sensor histidine kinase [Pirellulales bacterium]
MNWRCKNRLADLGQIASHVAHEVRNNLVPVSLYAGVLRRQLADQADSLDVLQRIETALTALDAMVHDMLNFTAERTPRPTTFPVRGLLDEIISGLAPQCLAQGIHVEVDAAAALTVDADRESLRRTLLNLVLNAIDAMPSGGDLVLTAVGCRDTVEIEVGDSGPGLSDEARRRAFEPFFTTKSSGIGLGLAIVQRLMEAHGGGITVCNCPEGGAAFTVRLPRRTQSLRAAA